MIVVHHLENSRSLRILWLLEELEVDYEIVRYQRDARSMLAPAALQQVHPLGKSPVVVDGEQVIAESGAIIEYLVATHGGEWLVPSAGTASRVRYLEWLHYAEGSLMPLLVMRLVISRLSKSPVPAPLRPVGKLLAGGMRRQFLDPQLQRHLAYCEQCAGAHTWLTGEHFSAADIQMGFPLLALDLRGGLEGYPALKRLLQAMRERPAYRRAVEKGGELNL
ncbi:glutathione S-transferase family protein [Salinicola avicenniae]|uniref:glutathione S-transferase family protein n=1 Tax=Salinicola avicenniae TaxID=2916836 RepID=UPI00207332C3|nr:MULTISPECIES: glutathione S-transferase [unclassified Salinicola]